MGNRLKDLREERGLSQEQLAERVHPSTTKTQISKLELGHRKLTREWAERLAAVLQCHWTEVMGEEPRLSMDEEALLAAYRGMSEAAKTQFRSLGDTLAQSVSGSKRANGGKQ